MTPRYIISANGRPITDLIAPLLESLTVTDETGYDSDRLTISLDDTRGDLELPAAGAVLSLQLGIGGEMVDFGQYTVDAVSGEGGARGACLMRIEAHAVPMAGAGKMQGRKSRSWEGLTFGAIVRQIAGENGLQAVVGKDLDAIDPGHLDQTDESDTSFLARIARDFSAALKVTAGRLAMIRRGASITASGESLPAMLVNRGDVSSWSWVISGQGGYRSVIASYRDTERAQTVEMVVGEGEPAYRMPHTYSNPGNARRAAQARLNDFSRSSAGELKLTMPPRLDIFAETPVTLTGIRQGVDGRYVVRRVTHTLDKGGGLVTAVDCERAL